MATTYAINFPDGQQRVLVSDAMLSTDRIIMLQPPMVADDGNAAVVEAQRLYITGESADGVQLRRYKVTSIVDEPQERVHGKLEMVKIATVQEVTNG
jgi:hypothetical protein